MIKVLQLFNSYPLFYQPYISPVLDALFKNSEIDIKIFAYAGSSKTDNRVDIIPSYFKRRIYERIYGLKYHGLNYLEIQSLRCKAEIIHIQHSSLYPKIKNIAQRSRENRPKIIITLRGGDTYVKPWINEKWKKFYSLDHNQIDVFIVMSENQMEYLKKWGVPEDKINIIPISFGHKSLSKPKYPNRHKLKLISAFRMCWEKNINGNLKVAQVLKEKGIDFQYDIYGDGSDKGQVLYLIDQYNLNDYCFYHGKIDNKDFKQILPSYDIFLQLSHSESLSSSILEAQSQGVPCVVSNIGGLPEVIIHNETGFSLESSNSNQVADKIIEIWSDENKYFSFSKKAISFVNSHFTVEHEESRLNTLYKNIVEK